MHLMKGGSLTGIAMPVGISYPESFLQHIAREHATAPLFLHAAAEAGAKGDLVERMLNVIAFVIAGLHRFVDAALISHMENKNSFFYFMCYFCSEPLFLAAESLSTRFWVRRFRLRFSTILSCAWSRPHIIHQSVLGIWNQRAKHGDSLAFLRAWPRSAATRYHSIPFFL
jgi:hypothetical protein